MKTPPEFFQGPIAQDFAGIADFDRSPAREAKKSPKTTPDTKNPPCSIEARLCKKKKKADAFLPAVEGWSMPPAPPAF